MKEIKKKDTLNLEKIVKERFGEKIVEWKSQYGKRQLLVITVDDKVAILRPITPVELSQFSILTASPDGGLDIASRYLLEELWIAGDTAIKDDDEYFMPAMLQLQNAIELKKSSFMRL